nr:nucleic acid-binding, OB-fold protein [Tanacetum cinerariifolium]
METLDNPFIAPVNIQIIESFLNRVSYQGVVDKDYIPLVSVYTTRNVIVRGMLIPNAFLTDEIRATDDYKEIPTLTAASPQVKKRKQCIKGTSLPQKSLKITITQKQVVAREKDEESYADKFVDSMLHDDVDDSGNRLEPKSHKEHLKVVFDDDANKEEEKDEKDDDEMGSLDIRTEKMMCKSQGYMIKNIERKCVTTDEFWNVHKKVDQVIHEIVPQLAEKATDDLIENNLKPCIAETMFKDRDAFRSEVPDPISQEFHAYAPKILEELFKQYLHNNMKKSLQDRANNISLWEVLQHNSKKSSTSNTSCRDDAFHSQHHDNHQDGDAPPQQQQQKEWDTWVKETIIDEDEVILKDKTPELIIEFQKLYKRVLTIFDHARIEATLNDMLSNQFRNAKESYVIWERGHDFQLGKESYQIKVNLIAPTLTFPCIEQHEPYSIIDKPTMGLIDLNNKDEKQIMYLVEIVKFCDAMLEKVLNEVKLEIFQSQFWKKPPLLVIPFFFLITNQMVRFDNGFILNPTAIRDNIILHVHIVRAWMQPMHSKPKVINMELIIMDAQCAKMHIAVRMSLVHILKQQSNEGDAVDYVDQFMEFLESCDDVGLIIIVTQLGKMKKWEGVIQVHNAFFVTKLFMHKGKESILNNDWKEIKDFRQGPDKEKSANTNSKISTASKFSAHEELLTKYQFRNINELIDLPKLRQSVRNYDNCHPHPGGRGLVDEKGTASLVLFVKDVKSLLDFASAYQLLAMQERTTVQKMFDDPEIINALIPMITPSKGQTSNTAVKNTNVSQLDLAYVMDDNGTSSDLLKSISSTPNNNSSTNKRKRDSVLRNEGLNIKRQLIDEIGEIGEKN